MATVD